MQEWRAARRACDPYLVAAGETANPDLEHFGISLPEGVEFGGKININLF